MKARLGWAAGVLGAALLLVAMPEPEGWAKPKAKAKAAKKHESKCNPQRAQPFLIRSSFVVNNQLQAGPHAKAIRYRTQQYGYIEGFGSADLNPHSPAHYAKTTTFFGLPIILHEKVVPALRCVEEEIEHACASTPYKPLTIGGFRDRNTYRGGEVTNHLYGIALDIDPDKNPCCRCVKPWPDHPLCKDSKKSLYERMAMPKCWVESFEKYGFYWLGRDKLQDTMHFEFLGKPDKIER